MAFTGAEYAAIASAVIGAGSSIYGAASRNSAAQAQSWQQMVYGDYERQRSQEFDAAQAEIARQFNADQGGVSRDWTAEQAALARGFTADQAATARQFTADQAQIARDYDTGVIGRQEAFQSLMAQRAMDFSERMSSTAYQRATADMRAAGINPLLAYSQGVLRPRLG